MTAATDIPTLPLPPDSSDAPASQSSGELAPAGQLVLPGHPGQQGLDRLTYSHESRPEGPSPYLGTHTGFCTAAATEAATRLDAPLPGQLRLPIAELDAAPQLDLWSRLEVAKNLLAAGEFDRQAKCQRTRRVKRDESIGVVRHPSGAYTLRGLVRCGLWTCPSCGPQRSRATSSALAVAFERHKQATAAADVWMLTLTIPHGLDEPLDLVVARLYDATQALWRSSAWRAFAAAWSIVGRVRVLDATHGGANGSHPHFHIALFPSAAWVPSWWIGEPPPDRHRSRRKKGDAQIHDDDEKQAAAWLEASLARQAKPLTLEPLRCRAQRDRVAFLDEQRDKLIATWERCARAVGARIVHPTEFRKKSLVLSPGEDAASYFLKWGLADEIGAPTSKARSHLRLLDAVANGLDLAGDVFLDFRRATNGRAWVTGLADVCKRYHVTGEDCAAYRAELRRKRELEAARAGEPLVSVRELALEIRPHLYAGALAARLELAGRTLRGWSAVFAAIDAADARGDDPQAELERFLWAQRVAHRREELARPSQVHPPNR